MQEAGGSRRRREVRGGGQEVAGKCRRQGEAGGRSYREVTVNGLLCSSLLL